jgi:hypothetical protein
MNCEHCNRPVDPNATKYWREMDPRIWFCNAECSLEWYETWRFVESEG